MAFKAGRWRNVMLICVVAPFFTSFILRTIAWRRSSPTTARSSAPSTPSTSFPVATSPRPGWPRGRGLTYNFLPFMVLPHLRQPGTADPRLIEAGGDLYANGFTTFRTVTCR